MNQQLQHYAGKLAYEIDSWGLLVAMNDGENVIVIDARSSHGLAGA